MIYTLNNISSIQTGYFAKPIKEGDVVYLQAKHFNEQGKLKTTLHNDLHLDRSSAKHLLQAGDILFAAKGNKNFATWYEKNNPSAVASTSFFVIRLNENYQRNILPEYIVWFLNNSETQSLLKSKAKGTSIPSIRKYVLEDLKINIPSIEKQKVIIILADLALKEYELSSSIQSFRKKLTEHLIINSFK